MLYLEYIWIDAFNCLRSKTQIHFTAIVTSLTQVSEIAKDWTFDGSSTGQAAGWDSDVIIRPVAFYNDPFRIDGFLVLCETYNKDDTPHVTNNRFRCLKTMTDAETHNPWFGLEQEYLLYEKDGIRPYGWKTDTDPGMGEQGPYYCSIGSDRAFGRNIVEEHMLKCVEAGVRICGTNAEVMPSQWEFQVGICKGIQAADELWIARYILHRVCEKYNAVASFYPKPMQGWNGSGCHTNFSTNEMRQEGGYSKIIEACHKLEAKHQDHIKVYGEHNEKRLTGIHETANIDIFSYGEGHRGCSIRIPLNVVKEQKGYLEDRRPASNIDPYLVTEKLVSTICLNQ
jgi:glutamine synthetase